MGAIWKLHREIGWFGWGYRLSYWIRKNIRNSFFKGTNVSLLFSTRAGSKFLISFPYTNENERRKTPTLSFEKMETFSYWKCYNFDSFPPSSSIFPTNVKELWETMPRVTELVEIRYYIRCFRRFYGHLHFPFSFAGSWLKSTELSLVVVLNIQETIWKHAREVPELWKIPKIYLIASTTAKEFYLPE